MKKAFLYVLSIIVAFLFFGCSKKEVIHVGVNAEILEISKELKGMVVKSLDQNSILGEKCFINCEIEGTYLLYVNNNTSEISNITFEDFIVGDTITVDVKTVKNKYAETSRVQLLTQRR